MPTLRLRERLIFFGCQSKYFDNSLIVNLSGDLRALEKAFIT